MTHRVPAAAIDSWKGCTGANHDFQFQAGSIEVKTTHANTPKSFHVSNIKQLDPLGTSALYLYFLMLEEGEAGNESLPELIDTIRGQLGGPARQVFDEACFAAGYRGRQRAEYETPRYTIRREQFFEVGEGFPRLLESMLPEGITGVRYEVSLPLCTPYTVEAEQVASTLFSLEGERQ